jgi:hypothetical protein
MITKAELNEFYQELEHRANTILSQWLTLRSRPAELRYYSGHYTKNSSGIYERDAFPIPVLSIKDLCDVEFHLDQIQVTTKLKKNDATQFNYQKIGEHAFEIYGLNDYVSTYGDHRTSVQDILTNIERSNESIIVFSFTFDNEVDPATIKHFIHQLEHLNFFY